MRTCPEKVNSAVRTKCTRKESRKGAIAVLSCFLLIVLMAAAAFAVDVSMMLKVQNELQRNADAAAMAGAWELVAQLKNGQHVTNAISSAKVKARQVGGRSSCGAVFPDVDLNSANNASGEIVVGRYTAFGSRSADITPDTTTNANAIAVTVFRSESRNGAVNFVFGRLLGANRANMSARAVAAFVTEIKGFKQPAQYNLPMLPFAIKEDKWNALTQGTGSDNYKWNEDTNSIQSGSDGVLELEMYAEKTGSSGNFGTIDLGAGSGTNELRRKIVEGLNSNDFAAMGGKLELGPTGTLTVSGDTGISAGMKDALTEIIGVPKIVPIYRQVSGNGTNAKYTLVKFVGVRVLTVNFQGSNKKVLVQPTMISPKFLIPNTDVNSDTSDYISAPVILVK